MKHGWEKIPNWECLFVHREKGLFLSVYVDDIKLAGKKHNIDPMWKVLNKEVDLGEPTSFLDHVYLGCTQRQCEVSQDIVDNYRTMFESRISAGGTEKLPFSQNTRISSWSYDMVGHAKKCVERYCELANETTQQLCKVSTPCIDDHHFKEEVSTPCFTGRILFMSMFNDISCEGKGNKEQCLKDADFVKTFARRFGIGQWSFIGPGSEKKWYPSENSPQGEWDYIAEDMLLKFAESGHPSSVQRHPCPEEN